MMMMLQMMMMLLTRTHPSVGGIGCTPSAAMPLYWQVQLMR